MLLVYPSPFSIPAASMQPPARPEQPAHQTLLSAAAAGLSALVLLSGSPAFAASSGGFRLPPISNDPDRCDRGYTGNTIGQVGYCDSSICDSRRIGTSNGRRSSSGSSICCSLAAGPGYS